MKKTFLSLLALGTLFSLSAKDTGISILRPNKEICDASKIGKSQAEGGSYGFETNDGWEFSEGGTASYSEDVAYDGKRSLHVVRSNTNAYFTAKNTAHFPIVGGERYRIGFYYKSQHSYGVAISLDLTTYDSAGKAIRTITGANMKLNADSLSANWSEFFTEFQAKNEAASATMSIIIKYGNADIYIDHAYCELTGEDVYDETFSTPKEDNTIQNWDLTKATPVDGTLEIASGGSAMTFWDRFLSQYGYTFTFDAKGLDGAKGKVRFEFYDTAGVLIQTVEKEYALTSSFEQKSVEITVQRGIKAYIIFLNDTGETLTIDNVHGVKSYSPNDESGWQGQWITYPDGDITQDAAYQNRWYRKTFNIPEAIASASLQCTADDVRYPYINGHAFGRGGVWSSPNIVDITDLLTVGDNVFAARVYNGTYYSGLLFEITIITESGRTLSFYSDKTTKTSKTVGPIDQQYITGEDTSWAEVGYDDSSWRDSYVVGAVGCMPWGSIPFVSLASTVPELEVVDAHFPEEVKLGDTMSFQIVWKPIKKIEKPITISASFWEKYSSDEDESDPAKSVLKQVSGPEMTEWKAGEAVTIGYEIDIPDFIDADSYMLQFDEKAIKIVNNPDYSNNKLYGHYIRFLPVELEIAQTSIVRDKGLTKLQIGEKEYAPYLFMQSDGLKYFKPAYAQRLYNSGMRLFSVGNNKVVDTITGVSTWTDDNTYNFDPFDETIYTTLSGAPKAKLLVMISCDPPSWWLNKYPEERALSANGGTDSVSYASKKWVSDVCKYMRAVLEHMKSMPYASHIFAVKFAQGLTYEWQEYGMELGNCSDFSTVAQKGWREFLKNRYKTESALQAAWGDGSVTFENATIPAFGEREPSTYPSLLDGIKQRSVMDYQDFKGRNMTNAIIAFASVVKEVSDGKWLTGTYHGYITNAFTYESSGICNNEFARLLEPSAPIDFFCGPVSYMTRQTGYSDSPMQTATSIVNAGKLCLIEFDERTVKVDMPDQSPATMDEWGKTYTLSDTINLMKRDGGNTLISGYGAWIYDMTGGWYDDSEIYNLTSLLMAEWEYAMKNQENENNREVAFVIEDKMPSDYAYNFGYSYSALEVNLGRQKEDLAAIGAGYDIYLASDFKKGLPKDYKLYLIVGNRFDQETIDGINKTCKKNASAVVWIGTPGIYAQDGSMSAGNISSLIDMDVALIPEMVYTAVTIDKENEDPFTMDARGITYGKPEIKEVNPAAKVVDTDAVTLGHIKGTDYVGLAYKDVPTSDGGTYTSVFSTFGHVPAMVLRNIMKKVGAHIYDESYSDVVFSSSGYLCIDSPYGGTRTITLPKAYDVYDVYNQELIGQNITSFDTYFLAKNTYLYRLMPAGTYGKNDPTPDNPNPSVDPVTDEVDTTVISLLTIGVVEIVAMAIILVIAVRIKKPKHVA